MKKLIEFFCHPIVVICVICSTMAIGGILSVPSESDQMDRIEQKIDKLLEIAEQWKDY